MKDMQEEQRNNYQTANVKPNNNQKAVLRSIAVILAVITMVSIAIGLFAWSKYTATQNGHASVDIAKWNFDLKLRQGKQGATATAGPIDLATTSYTHVADGKIAPGTSGEFEIIVNTQGTEVSLTYDTTISIANCPRNMVFYKKGPGESEFTQISAGGVDTYNRVLNFGKYVPVADAQNGNFVETIKWDWPYTGTVDNSATKYDEWDTQDQGKTVTMDILTVGTEVMNTPIKYAQLTDKNSNPLSNGSLIEIYQGGTDKINAPTGTEGLSYSVSPAGIVTVGTDGTVTAVSTGDAVITVTGNETGSTMTLNAKVKPPITAMVNGVPTTLTPDNTGSYYGSVVSDYTINGKAYQLFFIDYEGKYGEKGGIYLKQKDNESSRALTLSDKSIDSTDLKIKELNPEWAKAPDQLLNYDNEKAVAWLCATTIWSTDAVPTDTTILDKVRYAVGAPSIEMYVDSYNEAVEAYNKANSANLAKSSCSYTSTDYGYRYSGSRYSYVGKNSMYTTNTYWLASPACNLAHYVIYADNNYFYGAGYSYFTSGVAPLVCLKSDFQLNLQ